MWTIQNGFSSDQHVPMIMLVPVPLLGLSFCNVCFDHYLENKIQILNIREILNEGHRSFQLGDCYFDMFWLSINLSSALGSGMPSTSPPIIEGRKLFSNVARLGFAAAHDSPSLKYEGLLDSTGSIEDTGETSRIQGMLERNQLIIF